MLRSIAYACAIHGLDTLIMFVFPGGVATGTTAQGDVPQPHSGTAPRRMAAAAITAKITHQRCPACVSGNNVSTGSELGVERADILRPTKNTAAGSAAAAMATYAAGLPGDRGNCGRTGS